MVDVPLKCISYPLCPIILLPSLFISCSPFLLVMLFCSLSQLYLSPDILRALGGSQGQVLLI